VNFQSQKPKLRTNWTFMEIIRLFEVLNALNYGLQLVLKLMIRLRYSCLKLRIRI
jgi:hypothetical protein